MSNRMSAMNFQPADASGNVLPGAKLATFFSGTTTPITTFTDPDLTIAHTNPVIADGKGEFPQIFLSIAEHRMVLSDQNDVQVNVYDPVTRIEQVDITTGNSVEVQTATQGQTVFTLSNAYVPGTDTLGVYINGVFQHSPDNYIETSPTVITFTSGLDAGDEVTFVVPEISPLFDSATAKVTIADDAFTVIPAPKTSGTVEVFAELTGQAFGKIYYIVTGTAVANQAFAGSLFDSATGPLTGTTGTDGNMTVSANNDGNIYIENRLGSSKDFVYSFIVSP